MRLLFRPGSGSLFFITLLLCISTARGATILRVGSEELVNGSELIFEGRVETQRSEINAAGYIHTYVRFQVTDVLRGEVAAGTSLELRFTGGQVGEMRMDAGIRIPAVGERGIYFVEQLQPGLMNPLLGWEQGRFTISDDGEVLAGNQRAVHSVSRRGRQAGREFSQGVAYGVGTGADSQTSEIASPPLSVEEFKSKIRGMMR